MKKKILAWCDFNVPTGFANVAKNLLEDLHEEYELSILGINYHGHTKYDTSKWFVYSITNQDPLGVRRLPKIAAEENPDILFLFQDIFHISDHLEELKKALPEKTKIVSYFPIDGGPFSLAWGNVFSGSDAVITYSDWAIKTIKDTFPKINTTIHKLYHGVNIDTFYPHAYGKIKSLRKEWGWEGKFVLSNVNRFQPRKAVPLNLRAYSLFSKGYKECKCGNHMPISKKSCDLNMCKKEDIIKVVEHDRNDIFLYLHMMPKESSMGPGRANLLQNHILNAGFTDKDVNNIIGVNANNIYGGGVTEDMVNDIYNASNINVSSTLGEGCGLSFLESAATGTPSIAPKNSAIPEMLNGTGTLVKNNAIMNQAMDNAHMRPMVDPWELALAYEKEYKRWKKECPDGGKELRKDCTNNIDTNFLWDDKKEKLNKIFKDVLK
jgi:glycosyltransferase involved in cell wall biosynthesis